MTPAGTITPGTFAPSTAVAAGAAVEMNVSLLTESSSAGFTLQGTELKPAKMARIASVRSVSLLILLVSFAFCPKFHHSTPALPPPLTTTIRRSVAIVACIVITTLSIHPPQALCWATYLIYHVPLLFHLRCRR